MRELAVDVGSAVGYLDLDITGFLKNLKSAQDEANKTSKSLYTSTGKTITSIGKNIESAGKTLTKSVTLPLVGVGTAGLKVASDFEEGMSKVKAISGATEEQFNQLREVAIELGADTAFSSKEVADAMTMMAKAGWDSQQIIDGMGGVLDAAAASGEDLATVSTIVADAITGFGMAAKDSTKVADLLTKAANDGTIDINDLGESFKYIAPVANAMDMSIEDVTTALAAMSKAGIKGSQAGTSLRTMLAAMVKPTDKQAAAMEELGLEIANADGSFKSLDEIYAQLRTSMSKLTPEQQTYYATLLAGREGMSGLMSVLNMTQEEYDALGKSMDEAGGIAKETATIMKDNLKGDLEQLGGSLETAAIKLGDIFIPKLREFIQKIEDLVDKFSELDPATQEAIAKFAMFAAALGPVLLVVGKFTQSIGSIFTFVGKLPQTVKSVQTMGQGISTAFSSLAGSVGMSTGAMIGTIAGVVAIIAVLVAAFVSLWNNNEEFRDKVTEIWNEIKTTFETFTQGIVDKVNELGFDFENFSELLKGIWEGFCNFLAPIFEGVFQQVSNVFTFVTNTILSVLDIFVGLFTGDWDQVWEGVKGVFESVWTFISDTFNNVINTILGIFGTTREEISTKWTELWQNVKDWFEQKWNDMLTFFSELPYKIGYWLGEMLGKAITWAREFPGKAKTAATDFFNRLKEWFTELPGKLKSWLDNTIAKAKQFATDFPKKAKEAGEDFRDTLKTKLEELPGKMLSIGKNIVEGIWNGINNAKQWLIDKVSSFASGFTDGLKDALGIHSPSKVMEDEIGEFLPPGISNGFAKAMPSALSQMQKSLDKNMSNLSTDDVDIKVSTDLLIDSLKAKYDYLAVWFESIEQRINNSIQNMILSLMSVQNPGLFSDGLGYISYQGLSYNPFKFKGGGLDDGGNDDNRGGNTFIFNSPEPIDAIEAARLVRKTEKEIIEGF